MGGIGMNAQNMGYMNGSMPQPQQGGSIMYGNNNNNLPQGMGFMQQNTTGMMGNQMPMQQSSQPTMMANNGGFPTSNQGFNQQFQPQQSQSQTQPFGF